MKDNKMEYDLMVGECTSDSMIRVVNNILLFPAGLIAMAPIGTEDGILPIYGFFLMLVWFIVDMYMKMFLTVSENGKQVNIFTKYRMVPVSRKTLVSGKVALLNRFMLRCWVAFQGLQLLVRLLPGIEFFRWEALLPSMVLLLIYIAERYQIHSMANHLGR